MKTVRPSAPQLEGLVPYDPKYLPARVMLSANENSQSLPPEVEERILAELKGFAFNRYPDPLANDLRDAIAARNGLKRGNVLLGNAGDELLFDFALAWGGPGRKLLNIVPTFSVYAANARLTGTEVVEVSRKADYSLDEQAILDRMAQGDIDQVVITTPNNPTGGIASREFIVNLLNASDALVMADEAYIEFAGESCVDLLAEHENLIILRTFSKAYSCAGVRLGYVLANESVITELVKVRQPYSVDAVSQVIGRAVVANLELFEPRIEAIKQQRDLMIQKLRQIPQVQDVYDSQANFILVRVPQADRVWELLYEAGILVRDFSRSRGLEGCLRLSVGLAEENQLLMDELARILSELR